MASCSLALISTLVACTSSNDGKDAVSEEKKIALIALKKIKAGAQFFALERMILYSNERGLSLMSLGCTHATCLIPPVNELLQNKPETATSVSGSQAELVCPCHGSRFDVRGKLLQGPALRNLPWYALSVDDAGMLWADLSQDVGPEWTLKL